VLLPALIQRLQIIHRHQQPQALTPQQRNQGVQVTSCDTARACAATRARDPATAAMQFCACPTTINEIQAADPTRSRLQPQLRSTHTPRAPSANPAHARRSTQPEAQQQLQSPARSGCCVSQMRLALT